MLTRISLKNKICLKISFKNLPKKESVKKKKTAKKNFFKK